MILDIRFLTTPDTFLPLENLLSETLKETEPECQNSEVKTNGTNLRYFMKLFFQYYITFIIYFKLMLF